MCEGCRKNLHVSKLLTNKLERPQEIIQGPITLPLQEAFAQFKSAYDNYVANIGVAALEHKGKERSELETETKCSG